VVRVAEGRAVGIEPGTRSNIPGRTIRVFFEIERATSPMSSRVATRGGYVRDRTRRDRWSNAATAQRSLFLGRPPSADRGRNRMTRHPTRPSDAPEPKMAPPSSRAKNLQPKPNRRIGPQRQTREPARIAPRWAVSGSEPEGPIRQDPAKSRAFSARSRTPSESSHTSSRGGGPREIRTSELV